MVIASVLPETWSRIWEAKLMTTRSLISGLQSEADFLPFFQVQRLSIEPFRFQRRVSSHTTLNSLEAGDSDHSERIELSNTGMRWCHSSRPLHRREWGPHLLVINKL